MIPNPEYEPEAYDVICRVCDFKIENVSPKIAGIHMIDHSELHQDVYEPYFALRVASGYLGRDPDNPVRTPADGWNRPTSLHRGGRR